MSASMTERKRKQAPGTSGISTPEVGGTGRKLTKVVAAAWALFTREGFQTTSMEAIARDAGVSKATLYAYFPSKQALFAHLIVEECRRAAGLVTMPELGLGITEALRSFARQYTRMFIEDVPHRMAFFQILAGEAARFPELGQLMIDSGPRAEARRLAGLLTEASRQGLVDIADAEVAATQFLCLVRGELPIHSVLGLRTLTDVDIERTIEDGLRLFLKAYQPLDGPLPPRASPV